jgi:hypothetical protein
MLFSKQAHAAGIVARAACLLAIGAWQQAPMVQGATS